MAEPPETPRRRLTGAVAPALAAAALAGLGALALVTFGGVDRQQPAPGENCILAGADEVGGPISLTDGAGAVVTQADFAGAPAIVYFGFTHCPDICPTTMYDLAEALTLPGGYDVQPILISVDPERDTSEVMRQYAATEGFPAGLVGLTGAPAQVEAAKRAFRVYSAKAPIEGAEEGVYNVNHTSLLYVMDAQWRTRAIYRTNGGTPEDMARCIAAGLEAAG